MIRLRVYVACGLVLWAFIKFTPQVDMSTTDTKTVQHQAKQPATPERAQRILAERDRKTDAEIKTCISCGMRTQPDGSLPCGH
jgi:hypothetical protein